ncbi:Hint domain-containing protein [Falsiruegeria mediterranea]|uniref:Bifunctional hemolysin/adenylate cyclase n=1 Tax=Falsiruegeria mediterranea M17 TaxID=1200281 RepID=A0A2R8CBC3_9RHOB|nr:Hint domain-containing protein [Falsiruegeria mediterranea]SPJ29712.1 Bifunctional hemolysin/adenylate cyclase [Falsiruegeria mediterranea M17]
MATNFDNPYLANVIGLWDFRPTAETNDTGLGDGIAQDGTPVGDPDFTAGWMFTNDSDTQRFDVDDGDDAPFDLNKGTIITEFRSFDTTDAGSETVVSRGVEDSNEESDGGEGTQTDSGFFEVRVTEDGAVEVYHRSGGTESLLSSSDGFVGGGDVIKVSYSWSEDGVAVQVENLTQGTSETITGDTPGLTLDVTTGEEQSFTIGARETVEDSFDQHFYGGIDYVAVLDEPVIGGVDGNGIVEGTNGDDIIDADYNGDPDGDVVDGGDAPAPFDNPNEDVINGGPGNDSIDAGEGDDTVYAGAGDDTVNGEEGDDLLIGDGDAPGLTGPATRETFEWHLAPDPDDGGQVDDGDDLSGGFTQNTGSVDVTFSVTQSSTGVDTEFQTQEQFVGNIDTNGPDASDTSAMESELNGQANTASYELDFSEDVQNVSFRINDIDGDGQVQVMAYGPDGSQIPVVVSGGLGVAITDEDSVAGGDTATGDGGYANPDNSNYSVLVTIPGPVSRLTVSHSQDGPNPSEIDVTDVYFDVPLDDGSGGGGGPVDDGDDSLTGGEGDDTLIGQGGDDTLTGGDGNDSVDGGDGDDEIDTGGGDAANLPDRGFPSYQGLPEVPADPDVFNDRDTVDGGDGNDDISTGDDNDLIMGGAGSDTIDGGLDDDTISGGADDDLIIGSEGSDEITGDGGNDTIYGGLDPVFPDLLNITDDGSDGRDPDPEVTNGMDTLSGGEGNDLIMGQDDDDVLMGDEGDDTLDGGIDEDSIMGGVGNDEIIGGHGDDTLSGGDDRDTFLGGEGFDQIDGGSGGDDFDTLDLRGLGPVGIVYSSEDREDGVAVVGATGDVLVFEEIENILIDEPLNPDGIVEGTFGDDAIDVNYDGDPNGDFVDNDDALLPGQVGDQDIIVGKTGDDTIDAGADSDYVFAGDGADAVSGDGGNDTILGQDGDDLLEGDAGDDVVQGGRGNDTLDAGRGNDTMRGGEGDDNLTGNPGDDLLYGDEGDDTVIGNDGTDTLYGGSGNDTISTGPGNDEAFGGDDRDTIIVVGQDNQFVDGNEGGDDFDTLRVFGRAEVEYDPDNGENGVVYYLDASNARTGVTTTFVNIENVEIVDPQLDGVVEGGSGDDLIDASYLGDPEGDRIDNFDSFENFLDEPIASLTPSDFFEDLGGTPRGDQRDAVDAGAGNDTVYSGAGDDIVKGREGDDLIFAGIGFDDVEGGEGNDTIDGGAGSDKLYGSEGDDSLIGGLGGDTLVGGDGSDTLDGGLGNNFVEAGAGDDLVIGADGDDILNGGDGADTILAGGGDDVVVAYDPAFTGLASIGRSPDSIDGGAGNDQLAGGSGNDTILGGTGDDTLFGGIGSDQLEGQEGNDVVYGDSDISMVKPSDFAAALAIEPGNDTILGGAGEDTLYGEEGNDVILGGEDADVVFGGDDRDVIGAGIGDTIEGGEGGDDFDVLLARGLAVVDYDETDPTGESGTVTYYNEDLTVAGTAEFSEIENVYVIGAPTTTSATSGDGPVVTGVDGVVEGTAGDDIIDLAYTGDPEGDRVDGDDAVPPLVGEEDVILAGGGNDSVRGEEDTDVIFGGTGDDTVFGNGGGDAIDGGEGNDVLDGGEGRDIVVGGDGDDTLSGSNDVAGDGGDILSGQFGNDSFVNVGQGEVIIGGEDADGLDNDILDLTGAAEAVNPGGSLTVEFDPTDGEAGTVRFFDAAGDETGTTEFREIEQVIVPCFTPGTLIATPKGERRVEDLKIGDRVITRDNGIQEIKWLGTKTMTGQELVRAEHLNPILIREGALGGDLPERDMMVSPNHRVLVANDKTALYFEDREVLVAAKYLTGLEGVEVVEVSSVTYIHFMFDQHEVVLSDGTWTESFQPGDHTLAGLGNAQRNEIFELFPELKEREGLEGYAAARRSLKKHEAHLLTH